MWEATALIIISCLVWFGIVDFILYKALPKDSPEPYTLPSDHVPATPTVTVEVAEDTSRTAGTNEAPSVTTIHTGNITADNIQSVSVQYTSSDTEDRGRRNE